MNNETVAGKRSSSLCQGSCLHEPASWLSLGSCLHEPSWPNLKLVREDTNQGVGETRTKAAYNSIKNTNS